MMKIKLKMAMEIMESKMTKTKILMIKMTVNMMKMSTGQRPNVYGYLKCSARGTSSGFTALMFAVQQGHQDVA